MSEQNQQNEISVLVPETEPKTKLKTKPENFNITVYSFSNEIFKIFTNTENSFKLFCCVILLFISIPIDIVTNIIVIGLASAALVLAIIVFPFYAIYHYYQYRQWPEW